MIENRPTEFENDAPFDVICPDCGHAWGCTAKGRIISCGMCGKRIKNPRNPYINKRLLKPTTEIHCSSCGGTMRTGSKRYRITCSNCGAWVINENATYKPSRD